MKFIENKMDLWTNDEEKYKIAECKGYVWNNTEKPENLNQ